MPAITPYDFADYFPLFKAQGNNVKVKHQVPVKSITANYTAKAGVDTVILCDVTGGAITVTLPAAQYVGETFAIIKNNGAANAVTVSPASGTINGSSSASLASGAFHGMLVVSDGTNYWIVSSY